jgi:hypothetical protein
VLSTSATPAAEAIPEACPDGNEKLVSRCSGSSYTGRSRSTARFMKYVVRDAPSITPTVQYAALRCPRANSSTAATPV